MCHLYDIRNESWDTEVKGLPFLANRMGKVVVQDPCQ
jgi:hypothetical protein